jgi:hypothetical protein
MRYGCEQSAGSSCGGISGGTTNFISDIDSCPCPVTEVTVPTTRTTTVELDFVNFKITGPAHIRLQPHAVNTEITSVYIAAINGSSSSSCITADTAGLLPVTSKGIVRTAFLEDAVEYNVLVNVEATGLKPRSSLLEGVNRIDVDFCADECEEPCMGLCDREDEFCTGESTCTAGCDEPGQKFYECCPTGKDHMHTACRDPNSAASLSTASTLVAAALLSLTAL